MYHLRHSHPGTGCPGDPGQAIGRCVSVGQMGWPAVTHRDEGTAGRVRDPGAVGADSRLGSGGGADDRGESSQCKERCESHWNVDSEEGEERE